MIFEQIKKLNPHINFVSSSPLFEFLDFDTSEVLALSQNFEIKDGNSYIASDENAEKLDFFKAVQDEVFAQMKCQFGWCFGTLRKMNGMEWHKSSEVIVACSDMVVLLGSYFDIKDGVYDSKNTVGVYLKKGEVIELMPLTLHLAPLAVNDNFCSAIILPTNTNLALDGGIKGEKRAVNKWLLVHEEHKVGISLGGKIGVVGKNITLNVD